MALSVRYQANNQDVKHTPFLSISVTDGEGDGNETDNTYESIQIGPKQPHAIPYKCVDIKQLIYQRRTIPTSQGRNLESRSFDLDPHSNTRREEEDTLLRGYKYEFWSKPNQSNIQNENVRNRELSGRNENTFDRSGDRHGYGRTREYYDQNREFYGRNEDDLIFVGKGDVCLYRRNQATEMYNVTPQKMYGRHFGLVGTVPDISMCTNKDAIYGFNSERYGFSEILYKDDNELYNCAVHRNQDMLERYGYDVTDYVLNDHGAEVKDVERNMCEFGGNESDNTYESINIQRDPNDKVESAHDSSSGIASDVASYYPQTNMSTFKGDATGSDKTSEDSGRKSVSWASNIDSPRSSNHYVQMHITKQRQSPSSPLSYKHKQLKSNQRYLDTHVDKLGNKVSVLELQEISSSSKGKLIKPSPFDYLSDDVVLKILSYLPSDHLCRCARVCRRWYEFVWEPFLWTKIIINNKDINIDKALKILTKRLSFNTPYVCVILERVNLNGCEMLTDKGLQTIAKRCPELRHLALQGCHNITNMAVCQLVSNCVNLEHLDLSGCPSVTCISLLEGAVSHGTPRHQQQIYLRYLDMTDCFALEDEGLGIIAMHCSQLQFLYLRRCVRITDESMQYLANYCSTLREISVSDCRNVTDLGLRDLSKLGDNLRYLSVAKCDRMSDVGVRYLAKFCSKLRYLNVRGCEGVTDDSLELLSVNCPRMRSLDVGKCDITDEGLLVLAQNCPQLRKLSLKSCDSITDKGVVQLSYHCRGLQQLNIQDCNISMEGYKLVKRYCRRCIIEHTNPAFY